MAEASRFQLEQGTTPSTLPPSGFREIYPKSDGWYARDDAGTETLFATAADIVENAINPGVTDKAPSEDAVYNAIQTIDTSLAGKQPLDATLTALAAFNTNGILTQTAPDTFAGRTITQGTGISVSNGDGVAGNPVISLPNTTVTPGSFGSQFVVPSFTVDAQGRLTAASNNSAISTGSLGAVPTSRNINTGTGLNGGGDLSADRTLSLANTAVTPGTYGSASQVGEFTVDAQGRLTSALNVAIAIDVSQITTGTLPIARGGTNSNVALNNHRIMISSAGSIVEQSAITGNRALASDSTGLPVANATTDAELAFLSGVTSSVQTQINGKVAKAGDTMTGQLILPSFVINGSGGSGFGEFPAQASPPSTPSSGFRLYAGSTGKLSWKGSSGFVRTFDGTITADHSYTLPDTSGTVAIDTTTATGDLLYRNSGGSLSPLAIGTTGQMLTVDSGLPSWIAKAKYFYGNGSDGALTLNAPFTLSQNTYYSNLTIVAGGSLNLGNYLLVCDVLDLSNAPADAITFSGNPGNNSTATAGGAAPGNTGAAYFGATGNGSAGGASSTTTGSQAAAAAAQNPSNGGSSNASGAGGAGAAGAQTGGASRAGAAASNYIKFGTPTLVFQRNTAQILGGSGGPGGGGGGGSGTQAGTGGGSGGGGGGLAVIFARKIITTGSTASGAISSKGGKGGNSGNAANANAGSGGGGSGGGGGFIIIYYGEKSGSAVTNLVDASGGNGGNSGNANGTGAAGNAGSGGDGGHISIINMTTQVANHVTGAGGSSGGTGSGTTGATGGAGGSCVASL